MAAQAQEPAEAPPTVERGLPSRPPPSSDEPPPEKEKGDAERERPDSETESDVDDPYVQLVCFIATLCGKMKFICDSQRHIMHHFTICIKHSYVFVQVIPHIQ